MSIVAILGAGPIGASIAHRLAQRGLVRAIRLIDANISAAAGKALDIRQSGPVESFDTPITAEGDVLAAASASVIVLADEVVGGPWEGERGLGLMQRLVRAGTNSPFVFAAPTQTWLIEQTYRELKVPAHRLVGSAAGALVGAMRALAGLELGLSSVSLSVVGRPPALVVGWSSAIADGSLLTDRIPAHRLLALSGLLPRLWPPQPYAIASATAPVVEGLIAGTRRLVPALTVVEDDFNARGVAVMLPLDLGNGRVKSYVIPSLSPQELTEMTGGLEKRKA